MKKSIIEVIKSNKETIIKKSLIIGGTVAGLFIVGALLSPVDEEDQDEVLLEEVEPEPIEAVVEITEAE